MKKVTFIISCLCYIIIFSCKNERIDYQVNDNSILSYSIRDTLIYQNHLLQNDTFIVNNIEHYNLQSGSADETAKESYYFHFSRLHNSSDSVYYIIVIYYDYHIDINWENKFYYSTRNDEIVLKNFIINGSQYDNVRCLTSGYLSEDKLYYHYTYGVIQYNDVEGNQWKLLNRSIN